MYPLFFEFRDKFNKRLLQIIYILRNIKDFNRYNIYFIVPMSNMAEYDFIFNTLKIFQ